LWLERGGDRTGEPPALGPGRSVARLPSAPAGAGVMAAAAPATGRPVAGAGGGDNRVGRACSYGGDVRAYGDDLGLRVIGCLATSRHQRSSPTGGGSDGAKAPPRVGEVAPA